MHRRPRSIVAALVAAAALASCASGDPTGPGAGPSLYRLVSVDGSALPFSGPSAPFGWWETVTHGELLLRADGSFALGLPSGGMSMLLEGRWRRDGASLRLAHPIAAGAPDAELGATVAGDSVVLVAGAAQPSRTYVFRRASLPRPPVAAGTYVLTSRHGRSDLVLEYEQHGQRFVDRVLFDSLTFVDGLFYRRHRSEYAVSYLPTGDSLDASTAWITYGSYESVDGRLLLRDYQPRPLAWPVDSLVVETDVLARRWTGGRGASGEATTWEELYRRRP